MASTYKRKDSPYWWASFKDAHGKTTSKSTQTSDRQAAQRMADEWSKAATDIREHRVDPKIEKIRRELARPLIGPSPDAPGHLEDYIKFLTTKGDSTRHITATSQLIERVICAIDAEYPSTIDAEAVKSVIAGFRMPRCRKTFLSSRRRNAYLVAFRGFTRWMRGMSRAHSDPMEALRGFNWNIEADRRLRRRDLLPDEMARIIAAAESSTAGRLFTGKERAMVYRLCWTTGLRASEVKSLERESFNLAGAPPTVTVEAKNSKHRKRDILPITTELADLLRPVLTTKTAKARVFGALTVRTAKMLHGDMAAARAAWLAESTSPEERATRDASDYLLPVNHQGECADFHGIRHSFITQVVSSGADPATAMALARHGSPELTFKRYSHVRLNQSVKSTPKLPTLTPGPALKLTA